VARNNIVYIANLIALLQWYDQVRSAFISDSFPRPLYDGLKQTLCLCIDERIKQLRRYLGIMDTRCKPSNNSAAGHSHTRELAQRGADLEAFFSNPLERRGDLKLRDQFLHAVQIKIDGHGSDYIGTIKALSDVEKQLGTRWLQGIVDDMVNEAIKIIPSFDMKGHEIHG
jgi:UDP-N-acetylglucosamine/UDP-N-acetylgalactosamine diphosphorylase